MNIGDIKAFLGSNAQPGAVDASRPDTAIRQQLQESGMRQAVALQQSFQASASGVFSSQKTIGLTVYNRSLNQTLVINEQRYNDKSENKPEAEKSLFDFEEVAKNVLRFVGGVIKSVAAGGADQAKLEDMFGQARQGVLKGVSMASKDLEGFMNDEISEGIKQSQDLIELGIRRLEHEILGKPLPEGLEQEQKIQTQEQLSYQKYQSGSLDITTQDGDKVTLSFEDIQQFEFNRSQLISTIADQQPASEEQQASSKQGTAVSEQEVEASTENPGTNTATEQPQQPSQPTATTEQESYQYYQKQGISFSLKGELDESEMSAIGDLVEDANKLAEQFFNGDVEQAFDQALSLGFDEAELTGFALELNRSEQVQVVRAYEEVQNFTEEDSGPKLRNQSARPVADYLEQLLNVLESSSNKLQNKDQYETLMNGLVNQTTGLQMPDLLDAINRFHSFNNQLIENIPSQNLNTSEA